MEFVEYHPFVSPEAKSEYIRMYDEKAKKWPVPSETRMVETSYGQTFVRICGLANGEPLVLLHGAGSDSLSWIPNVKALSSAFRIYAVDTIGGCGRSVYTRDLPGIADYLCWLDELLTSLQPGDRKVCLMGGSYGGMLSCQYALHHPNRVDKVVLLAPAATVLPTSPKFKLLAILFALRIQFLAPKLYFWLFEDFIKKDPGNLQKVESYASEKNRAHRSFKGTRHVFSPVLTDEELQRISVPMLFVVGENEKMYSARRAIERLNRIAPHVKTRIIPNAGHDLTCVNPDLINQVSLEFLKEP